MDRLQNEQKKCPVLAELRKDKSETPRVYLVKVHSTYSMWMYRIKQNKDKHAIYVPQVLQVPMIEWYHTNLSHPGISRMIATIGQHFAWP